MRPGRLALVVSMAAAWLAVVVFRLYALQVRDHESYRAQALQQQQKVVELYPPRGTIFDAHGRELAVSVEVSSAAAVPSKIEDPEAVAQTLEGLVANDDLVEILSSGKEFAWIERKLDQPRADALRAARAPGIFFVQESKRYYPLRDLAAPVLGYVGTDNTGLAGLEFLYDHVVASEPGRRTVLRDARAGTVPLPKLQTSAPTPGQNLHLTLDAAIQYVVERELEKAVTDSGARKGMVVVLDPQTGAVLAMASRPTFDPNAFGKSPQSHWRNQPVEDAFEPGSTFKMITLAAALEEGVVDPLEEIDCEMGGIRLNGVRIADHKPFGLLTTREIIAKSSNVGAIKLGYAAGRARLAETIQRFGFGRPTGIDLPSESSGILRPLERWSKLSPAYISFGHSVSVTTVQLANAFAVIANGGRLLRPYVVAAIGDRPSPMPRVVGLPISPSSVVQVRSMLESVVIEGTAKSAALDGYRAAGKTGTAEKVIPGRGYAKGKYIASFVGFAPVKDPALVIAVILDEPWPRYHGGEVAAPVFRAIASQTLLYLGVRPERQLEEVWPAPPTLLASVEQQPSDPAPDRAPVQAGTVPDFAGLSARQAVTLSASVGLQLALNGHGSVGRQLPAPGTPLEVAGDRVELWLEDRAAGARG